MVPASWRSKPPIIRRSVVFPHPLGPSSETNVPGRMVRVHSLTASTSANRLEMPSRAIAGPSSSTLSSTGAGGAAATFFCVVDKSGRLYTLRRWILGTLDRVGIDRYFSQAGGHREVGSLADHVIDPRVGRSLIWTAL